MKNLTLHNLKTKKARTALASLSIAIAAMATTIFFGLSNGIQIATFAEIESGNPLNQITITPEVKSNNLIGLFTKSTESQFPEEKIQEIQNIPGVTALYKETQFNQFASLQSTVFGISMITDSMIFGVPSDFLKNDLSSETAEQWDDVTTAPYPAIIPRRILDLYNLGIATPRGLPTINEQDLLGKELTLFPNYSTFFPGANDQSQQITLQVVGFSNKVNLLGATIPEQVVEQINQQYTSQTSIILQLHAEINDTTKIQEIAAQIEALGYQTNYIQKNIKEIETQFTYVSIGFGLISFIIMLTAGLAISATFLATIEQRRKQIGLYRALGATRKNIRHIILSEATIIGVAGAIIGIITALVSGKIINSFAAKQLTDLSITTKEIITITPQIAITSAIFCLLLTTIAAYFPARKAMQIKPLEALR